MFTSSPLCTRPLAEPLPDLAAWTEHLCQLEIPVLEETAVALDSLRAHGDDVDAKGTGGAKPRRPPLPPNVAAPRPHRPKRLTTRCGAPFEQLLV